MRPGLYKESIVIDKSIEIIGDGDRDKIVIESFGTSVVLFEAKTGRLVNLTLRQAGSEAGMRDMESISPKASSLWKTATSQAKASRVWSFTALLT